MTPTAASEESRAFFQTRLALMYRVGLLLSASFLIGVIVARGLVEHGSIARELSSPSRWFHIGATVVVGAVPLALRRPRSALVLDSLDIGGLLVLSALLVLNAGLFEIRTVSVFNLALSSGLAAVLRSVLVPSTPGRTLGLGLGASAMAVAVFFASALHPAWPVKQVGFDGWPLSFQLISLVLWLGALNATAVVASRVIYKLRHEVRVARRLGQYVLGEKIGAGGMGVVYRATHAMLRRDTALKLLPPDVVGATALRRFEREVVETARLRHPNTVAIYDYGRTPEGVFYYAMEYLDGLTVGELVSECGPLPPGRVVHLLAQACASLEEAHGKGLVHRDIKPANIMVTGHPGAYDLVKVLDFGLVKDLTLPSAQQSLGGSEFVVGTPQYMPPESITAPERVDRRSDLYALCAVGYLLLTGTPVFEGHNVVELCAAHLDLAPQPPGERLGRAVPAELEALLLSGLAKSPDARPESAKALRDALLACDVPPWTDDDARAFWLARGDTHAQSSIDLAHAPTLQIAVDSR
ncbi:MAG: serine/threonine protein kinase [Polyangiaceae bacterium]|nr:serine/threonine protein kinase [Polyangiaceae bacterium]